MSDDDALEFETRAIHAGQAPDAEAGSTIVPVYQTSTYTQAGLGQHRGHEYARISNPTRSALESAIAALEGGRHGLAYASGMAAIAGLVQSLGAGDHVVAASGLYGGTHRLFAEVMSGFGVAVSYVDATDLDRVDAAFTPRTRLLWIETPSNPLLELVDIRGCADIAGRRDALLAVDNTFATPYYQQPLALGADAVVHSTTKYLGGHSDVIGGATVVNDDALHDRLRRIRNATGGVPGPWDAWLVQRGLKTLALRMRAHSDNALAIARWLDARPEVSRVRYPGLDPRSSAGPIAGQMSGHGGMIAVELAGGEAAARRLCEGTRLFQLAESLGGVESLIGYPWTMSHAAFSDEMKRNAGITPALVRLSVGIEHVDDLLADLERGLSAAG